MSDPRSILPTKRTRDSTPFFFAASFQLSRSGPSPATTKRCVDGNSFHHEISSATPFHGTARAAVKITTSSETPRARRSSSRPRVPGSVSFAFKTTSILSDGTPHFSTTLFRYLLGTIIRAARLDVQRSIRLNISFGLDAKNESSNRVSPFCIAISHA